MNWILLTPENCPETEVLAGNFLQGSCGYKEKIIGYITINKNLESGFKAENDHEVLENCTHYIPINDFNPTLLEENP